MVKAEIDCCVKFSYFSVLDVIHRNSFFSSKPSSKTWKQLISHHQEAFITVSLRSTKTKTNSVRRQRQHLTAGCRVLHSQLDESHKERDSPCSLCKEHKVVSQLFFSKWETTLLKSLAQGHTQFALMPRSELGFSNARTLPTMKYYIYHLLTYQTRYNFFFLILYRYTHTKIH